MQQVVWISLVLLNVVWISFFLTPDLDFSVFVQRRSKSSSDETFMMEFCLQPEVFTKWTSTESPARRPDEDINIITELTAIAEQDLKQTEMFGSADQNNPSNQTDHEANSDLYGPTASTDEQRLTPPSEFSSEADRVAKVPTTPRNQKVNVNQPDQHRIIDSSHSGFPDDCCFEFFRLPMNKKLISSYSMTDNRCAKRAVILITHRKRNICADPSQPWVKNVMNFLDINSF
ncbi:uncharacterized protein LOC114158039 isoform X3 [Xiphophorus couchianus]|uniref:uncharacterized protein LOC114158039 isoform X3 n=1 Tax=Xiphophorus couchianus TaxID=32473 RepID=UPI001015F6FC|nr:uncharacterized protein LOC114158039 isoform X3 [Xiphophorus couchianus]